MSGELVVPIVGEVLGYIKYINIYITMSLIDSHLGRVWRVEYRQLYPCMTRLTNFIHQFTLRTGKILSFAMKL